MNQGTRERFLREVVQFIEEGKAVLRTQFCRSGGQVIDFGDPYVASQPFQKWVIGVHNLTLGIGPPAKIWSDVFANPRTNQLVQVESMLGALEALRDALTRNLLAGVESLVFAEAFGSLLEQAEVLFASSYILAAGVLGRAVLEEHLRKLCDRYACMPPGQPTIEPLKQALAKAGHLDKLNTRRVEEMATAGNHCAHNLHPPLTKVDVEKLLRDVQDFLVRNPLP